MRFLIFLCLTSCQLARIPDEIEISAGRSELVGGIEATGFGVKAKWDLRKPEQDEQDEK